MRYSEICGRQVVNVHDGTLLGLVKDLEFDPCTFQIHAIFVSPAVPFMKKCFPWLFHRQEIEISIKEIEHILGDVILVRYS